ncbi:MAG: hypothetical protein IJ475_01665 [Bacilli bacterium]|nr:hypothetical protein [Bacilli bacterium]
MKKSKFLFFGLFLFLMSTYFVKAETIDFGTIELGESVLYDSAINADYSFTSCSTDAEGVNLISREQLCVVTPSLVGDYTVNVQKSGGEDQLVFKVVESTRDDENSFTIEEFVLDVNTGIATELFIEDKLEAEDAPEGVTEYIINSGYVNGNTFYLEYGYAGDTFIIDYLYSENENSISFQSGVSDNTEFKEICNYLTMVALFGGADAAEFVSILAGDYVYPPDEEFNEISDKYIVTETIEEDGVVKSTKYKLYLTDDFTKDMVTLFRKYNPVSNENNNSSENQESSQDDGSNPKTGVTLNISVIVILVVSIIFIVIKNKASVYKI